MELNKNPYNITLNDFLIMFRNRCLRDELPIMTQITFSLELFDDGSNRILIRDDFGEVVAHPDQDFEAEGRITFQNIPELIEWLS